MLYRHVWMKTVSLSLEVLALRLRMRPHVVRVLRRATIPRREILPATRTLFQSWLSRMDVRGAICVAIGPFAAGWRLPRHFSCRDEGFGALCCEKPMKDDGLV